MRTLRPSAIIPRPTNGSSRPATFSVVPENSSSSTARLAGGAFLPHSGCRLSPCRLIPRGASPRTSKSVGAISIRPPRFVHREPLGDPRAEPEQRNVDLLLVELAAVPGATMLEKLLAVIRGHDHMRLAQRARAIETIEKRAEIAVGAADLGVVETDELGDVLRELLESAKAGEIADAAADDAGVGRVDEERGIRRIGRVGAVRVEEMDVGEVGRLALLEEHRERLVEHLVVGGAREHDLRGRLHSGSSSGR